MHLEIYNSSFYNPHLWDMGIETLLSREKITPDMVDRIVGRLNEPDPSKRQAWSPPHALAIEFGEWGKNGLSEMSDIYKSLKLNQKEPLFESHSFKAIESEDQLAIRQNTAAVKFTTVMMGLEMALAPERTLNLDQLYKFHNEAVKSFPRLRIARPKNAPRTLTQAAWQNLVELTKDDKSHAVIFTKPGFQVMPYTLRLIVGSSLEDIRRDILPAYSRLLGAEYKPKHQARGFQRTYESKFPTLDQVNVIFDRLTHSAQS